MEKNLGPLVNNFEVPTWFVNFNTPLYNWSLWWHLNTIVLCIHNAFRKLFFFLLEKSTCDVNFYNILRFTNGGSKIMLLVVFCLSDVHDVMISVLALIGKAIHGIASLYSLSRIFQNINYPRKDIVYRFLNFIP